ncbi:Gfo/Idh/MocA family oxidoreductase [Ruficoccus amylovorans]|uniref:Gfo/Idh/MocA family oxidoreductase n=1 Tax=Ruficoccus amylovorans TaxID=1804625 RepID=A0A842HLB9_9BACT|nr:Gfo/Idh/MocA family oxidoreductase [Ruficoccus amylovorans]MBC2595931.1 Gfo/Idh/MocA family oxidoreductase [Ruficoccus amylovorans]
MNIPKSSTDIVIVGSGGYGRDYMKAIERIYPQGIASISAIVDPVRTQFENYPGLTSSEIAHYSSLDDFLRSKHQADLVVISTPISYHAEQSCALLRAGYNVLCEKPMAATLAEAQQMRAIAEVSECFIEIGYQWSFSDAIQRLKADILGGRLGKPLRLKTRVAWPRASAYYQRNHWAGKIRDPKGRHVNDSPINNAAAHYLHNMLYLTGPTIAQAATPIEITGECYRANAIENFDAACCRIKTLEDVEILFYAAHCVKNNDGPVFEFEFEHATVGLTQDGEIVAICANSEPINYGNPEADPMCKLWHCIRRVQDIDAVGPLCGVDAAFAHTVCVYGMQQMPVHSFGEDQIRKMPLGDDGVLMYMEEMDNAMVTAFDTGKLFSELNLPWASPSVSVELLNAQLPVSTL